MAAYWERMLDLGTSVIAIRETPEMGIDVPDCLSTRGADLTDCGRPAATALAAEAPTIQATRTTDGRVGLVDMTDLLCPDAMCAPVLGDVVVYRDAHHLTRSYTLTPGLLSGGAPSGRGRTPGLSRPARLVTEFRSTARLPDPVLCESPHARVVPSWPAGSAGDPPQERPQRRLGADQFACAGARAPGRPAASRASQT